MFCWCLEIIDHIFQTASILNAKNFSDQRYWRQKRGCNRKDIKHFLSDLAQVTKRIKNSNLFLSKIALTGQRCIRYTIKSKFDCNVKHFYISENIVWGVSGKIATQYLQKSEIAFLRLLRSSLPQLCPST